jgi:hypothetical protein
MMDGGLATAAAAGDVARVDAAEADATGPDASRADASQASSVAMCSSCETGLAASVAALLEESTRFHTDVLDVLKSLLRVLEENGLLALLLIVPDRLLKVATFNAQALPGELRGRAGVIMAAVVSAMAVSGYVLVWILFLIKKCGPRDVTHVESGGRGWFWACRCWDGGTKGSRRMRVCIYYSTRGRYGSSRLRA